MVFTVGDHHNCFSHFFSVGEALLRQFDGRGDVRPLERDHVGTHVVEKKARAGEIAGQG